MSRLISPSVVRRYLLSIAANRRHHQFRRVSRATIDRVEGEVRRICSRLVDTAPSKGVTL